MTLTMMVMMICSTIISQTSDSSSSGFRWATTKTKTFLKSIGQDLSSDQLIKVEKIKLFGHSRAPKNATFWPFFPPGEIDHIGGVASIDGTGLSDGLTQEQTDDVSTSVFWKGMKIFAILGRLDYNHILHPPCHLHWLRRHCFSSYPWSKEGGCKKYLC